MSDLPTTSRQILSCVTSGGKLQLTIGDTPVVAPGDAEVVVRIEASPINPSDLGLLLGMADIGFHSLFRLRQRSSQFVPVADVVEGCGVFAPGREADARWRSVWEDY